MGNDIDKIGRIKNAELRDLARTFDANNDKKLGKGEISIFKAAAKEADFTETDIAEALTEMYGLTVERSEESEAAESPAQVSSAASNSSANKPGQPRVADPSKVKASKKQRKMMAAKVAELYAKGLTKDKVIEELEKTYPASNPKLHNLAMVAADMVDTVEEVWNATSTKNKSSVKDLSDKVEEKVKDMTDEQEAILDAMVSVIERRQIESEIDVIVEKFNELMERPEVKNAIKEGRYADVMALLEKALGKTLDKKNSYYKEIFDEYRKTWFAGEIEADFVSAARNTKAEDADDVKDEIMSTTNDAIATENFDADSRDMDYDIVANHNRVYNRREQLGSDAVRAELGVNESNEIDTKKARVKFNKAWETAFGDIKTSFGASRGEKIKDKLENYLSRPDVNYDMTAISKVIEAYAGADCEINGSKQGATEELQNIADALNRLMGLTTEEEKLDKTDAKILAKFCGFTVTDKDYRSMWEKGNLCHLLHDGSLGAVAGAVGGYVAGKKSVEAMLADIPTTVVKDVLTKITINAHQSVIINGQVVSAQDAQRVLDLIQKVETTEHLDNVKDLEEYARNSALDGALAGLITGIIAAIVGDFIQSKFFGEDLQFEKAIIAETNAYDGSAKFQTFEEYSSYIKGKYGEKANDILELASKYNKNGKFDFSAYAAALNRIAGPGSVTNPKEWRAFQIYGVPEIESEDPVISEEEEENSMTTEDCSTPEIAPETRDESTFEYHVKYGDNWKGIVEAFYPDLAKGPDLYKKVIPALKKALGIPANATNIPSILHLPYRFMDVERKDNNEIKRVKKQTAPKKYVAPPRVGGQAVSNTVIVKPGQAATHCATATDDKTGESATGTTRDEAASELERKTQRKYSKRTDK